MSTLDNLRKAAKRWLRALRAGDHEARERLRRAYPGAPAEPGLRDVQHALAREHGHDGWSALRQAHDEAPAAADVEAAGGRTHAERVATFLEFACWDHHVYGKGDHAMHGRAANRLLAQHPEIALDSLYTAVVCGELAAVERRLSERPEAAREPGGSRGWTPILYLCYTRFPHQPTRDNAVAIARALLDRGANPNDFYMAGDSSYTALVGVAGEGEQDSPRQPQAEALFQLLLERGAEPFDIQVLYNTHFSGDVLWWLRLIYAHTMKTGRTAEWSDPNWSMLDMGGYGPGAHFLLRIAVEKNDLTLAEWLLSHGASPDAATSPNPQFKRAATHYQTALREGFNEMAALLVRYGATPAAPVLNEQERFIAACLRLDRDEVRAHLEKHPEDLQSPAAIFAAARKDRADVVEFLLDLGVPIDIQDRRKQRPLHEAAGHDALRAAASLIERGANVDPRDLAHNATPLGYAVHYGHDRMIEFLSQFSRDVWNLAFTGSLDRLRDVLREDPELAKVVDNDGFTPLWWLPDDEAKAIEIVELFLSYGADPSIRSQGGTTAADWALKRGMLPVARKLATVGATVKAPAPPDPHDVGRPASAQVTPQPSHHLVDPDVPVEMRTTFPMELQDGVYSTTTEVWDTLTATRDGNLERVTELVSHRPSLVHCDYNYMRPLHLAVREGHLEIVRFLLGQGAADPKYVTYPYKETLLTVAGDRGYGEIAQLLVEHLARPDLPSIGDSGDIKYGKDETERRFQKLVGANALGAVEAMLKERPELALDEFAFWSEGILLMPAGGANRKMLELLMRYGARVPDVSKWGPFYYFKHDEIAAFLLENGMNANHRNCHHTTLLHEMARMGDLRKARLLLEHGAAIDAIDQEFRSTPLGFAARWGQREMAGFLIESGADPNASGAPWATPLAWARKKGHADIEADLQRRGAR